MGKNIREMVKFAFASLPFAIAYVNNNLEILKRTWTFFKLQPIKQEKGAETSVFA